MRAGVASFHGSPLVRNGSTARPGTNVSVVMFNGYDDAGVTAKAKADVQVLMLTQAHAGQPATGALAVDQGVNTCRCGAWTLLKRAKDISHCLTNEMGLLPRR